MKKFNAIFFGFGIGIISLFLVSNSGGRASSGSNDSTGSPINGNQTCAMCHGSNNFTPSIASELKDANGNVITGSYTPGETYILKITMAAGTGAPTGYGWQATVLDASNSMAGSFASPMSGAQVSTLSGVQYIEQTAASPVPFTTVEWTAPAAGAGDVTIYAAGICSNTNSGAGGDGAASLTPVVLTEASVSSVSTLANGSMVKVYPNPVINSLQVDFPTNWETPVAITLTNISGKVLSREEVSNRTVVINTEAYNPGVYILTAQDARGNKTSEMIRK
jgi:hypothetical protein